MGRGLLGVCLGIPRTRHSSPAHAGRPQDFGWECGLRASSQLADRGAYVFTLE